MGKNKPVEAHIGELRCCAISVAIDKTLLEGKEMKPELKVLLGKVSEVLKKYDSVGMQPNYNMMMCLFDATKEDVALAFYNELVSLKIEGVVSINPVKNACYIDMRYLEGMYKNVQVALPPRDVDEAIIEMLEEYCFDWKFTQDPVSDIFAYIGDLGGGRNVQFIIQHGNKRLAAGMNNGTLRQTENLVGYWKRILQDTESDLIDWSNNHKGIAKIYREHAQA